MFSKKPTIIIFITPTGFDCIRVKDGTAFHFDFPANTVSYQDITDPHTLTEAATAFFTKQQIEKQTVVIVLSDLVVYQKQVQTIDPTNLADIRQSFLNALPIEANETVFLEAKKDSVLYLLATSNRMYALLSAALTALDNTICGVYPAAIFYAEETDQLTGDQVEIILSSIDLVKNVRFHDLAEIGSAAGRQKVKSPPVLGSQSQSKKRPIFKIIAAIGMVVIGIGAVVVFGPKVQSIATKFVKPQRSPATQEASPSATPKATVAPKARQDLTVQVLNGSAKVGAAAKTKTALEKDQFQHITTGNSPTKNTGPTTVTFSESVSETDQNRVKTIVTSLFPDASVATASGQFDIAILIGN